MMSLPVGVSPGFQSFGRNASGMVCRMERLLLVLVLSAGCAKKPDAADAKGALTLVQSLAAVDAASALRVSYQGCSELPGCAGGCADAFAFCASADSDEVQRKVVLTTCSSEAKQAFEKQVTPDAWFRGHLEQFLDASRPLLDAESQRRFDAARAKSKK